MSDTQAKAATLPITAARVIVTCPGRNFVTVKIETGGGGSAAFHGLGDATLNGRELSVASYLTDHVIPTLIGRDAHQIEDIWQFLYRGAYWRRGPVTMTAIAAVDMALWDIKAKAPACRCTSCWVARAATVCVSMDMPTARPSKPRSPRHCAIETWATPRSGCRPACPDCRQRWCLP